MRNYMYLCLVICFMAFSCINESSKTILNPDNLDGWVIEGNKDAWKIEDGILTTERTVGQNNWLRYDSLIRDFEFSCEWKMTENVNTGIFFRSDSGRLPWITGAELQITNRKYTYRVHHMGSIYNKIPIPHDIEPEVNVWHELKLKCQGTNIQVWIDGEKTLDADTDNYQKFKDFYRLGYVGIQDSHEGNGKVEYRNIRLKILKSR